MAQPISKCRKHVTTRKGSIFLSSLLLFPLLLFAQNQQQKSINNLIAAIAQEKKDTTKIYLLDSLSYILKNIDPDKGIMYARQELQLAEQNRSQQGIAMANTSLGENYEARSDYPEALECFYIALSINEKRHKIAGMASNYNSIGVIYHAQNNDKKALENYKKALNIDMITGNAGSIAGDMGNIGNLYMTGGNMEKALEYDSMSLSIFKKIKDSDGIAHNLGNMGNIYQEQKKFIQAISYDRQALAIFSAEGDKSSVALNLGNIAGVYLKIARDSTHKINYSSYGLSGKTACINTAIRYLDTSLVISKEIKQWDNIMEFSEGLSVAYSLLGDYKRALESYKQYTVAKDSIFSNDDKEKIAQLSIQRELQVKDKQLQIDKLQNDHKRYHDEMYLACIALVLLILGIILKRAFPKLF